MRRALHELLITRGQGTARSLSRGQLLPCLQGTLGSAVQQQCNISVSPHACAVGSNAIDIFDRKLKQAHRDRAAQLQDSNDPLLVSVTEQLLDRLEDVKRTFPTAVILGGAGEQVARGLAGGRAGIQRLLHLDMSAGMLARAQQAAEGGMQGGVALAPTTYIQADEEYLPLKEKSVDLIISCLGLHWVNDLPGALVQCRRALKPDGLLLAVMFGGDTLHELRVAVAAAEEAVEGGISQRVSPLAQVADAGSLLTAAGFNIPSVDLGDWQVHYKDFQQLTGHLRELGESNAVRIRRPHLHRGTAAAAAQKLAEGGTPDGIPCTYQGIFLTGWSPAPNQQRPARRGSASASFEDIATAVKEKEQTSSQSNGSKKAPA